MVQFRAEKLRIARKVNKLSYERMTGELAKQGCSVSRETLRSWEIGRTKPGADLLPVLAQVLNKPIAYFFN